MEFNFNLKRKIGALEHSKCVYRRETHRDDRYVAAAAAARLTVKSNEFVCETLYYMLTLIT